MTATRPPRPAALPVIVENIPRAMTAYAQFLIWGYAPDDNGWTKPPLDAKNGRKGSSTNRRTWAPFTVALDALDDALIDGLGFAVAADDPFVVWDLDKCRDPETGNIAEWAQAIIQCVDSYTEVSPSGTGIRIIAKGLKPGPRCTVNTPGKIELYDRGRFITLTGQHLPGTPNDAQERQEALDTLYAEIFPPAAPVPIQRPTGAISIDDAEVLERARRSKVGPEFERLWDGDTSAYNENHSSADLALNNHLRFFTGGDPVQMDRLFRQSGLMRPKWDRPARSGETYGEGTIARALPGDIWTPPVRFDVRIGSGQTAQPTSQATNSDVSTASSDGEVCALERARIAELEAQLSDLQAQHAELSRRHSNMTQLLMNPNLTPTEAIAAVLVLSEIDRKQAAGKVADDGRIPVYLDEIGKGFTRREETVDADTGEILVSETVISKPRLSKATISRALDKFDEWGMIEKTVVTSSDKPRDRRTGPPKTELYVRPMHQTTRETMRVMACYNPSRIDPDTGREKRHGGSLPRDQRPFRCEAHPDGNVILKTDAWCADCGDFLGTVKTETVISATPFQVETGSENPDTPSTVEDVLMGDNLKRGTQRAHPHRSPTPIHDETQSETPTCRYCSAPLYSDESRARGTCTTHRAMYPSHFPIAAGGDD